MKTIIEQYGITVLAAIVVMAIFGILLNISDGNGNTGIFEIVAANSDMDNSLYENMTDTRAVIEANSIITAPTITYKTDKANMKAQVAYSFGDYVETKIAGLTKYLLSDAYKEANKGVFTYEILDITSSDGMNCSGIHNASNGTITFPSSGQYEITIRCRDLINGKETTSVLYIPVDR